MPAGLQGSSDCGRPANGSGGNCVCNTGTAICSSRQKQRPCLSPGFARRSGKNSHHRPGTCPGLPLGLAGRFILETVRNPIIITNRNSTKQPVGQPTWFYFRQHDPPTDSGDSFRSTCSYTSAERNLSCWSASGSLAVVSSLAGIFNPRPEAGRFASRERRYCQAASSIRIR